MKTRRERLMVSVTVLAVGVICVGWSLQFSWTARRMPLFAGVLTAAMAAVQLIADLRPASAKDAPSTATPAPSERSALAWTIVLVVAVSAIGISITLPLFITLYWRIKDRASWPVAIAGGLAVAGFVRGLLVGVLHVELYGGLIPQWLGW